jgi:hypothetical protein
MKLAAYSIAFVPLFAALLAGCAPWPHFVTIVPEVKGQVVQSGNPISNATILTRAGTSGTPCETSTIVTKTNDEGSFTISPLSQFRIFYVPLVEPIEENDWELCIEHQAKLLLGFHSFSPHGWTDTLSILCDVDQRFEQRDGIVRSQFEQPLQGVCKQVSRRKKE